jgi:hypothetical protein
MAVIERREMNKKKPNTAPPTAQRNSGIVFPEMPDMVALRATVAMVVDEVLRNKDRLSKIAEADARSRYELIALRSAIAPFLLKDNLLRKSPVSPDSACVLIGVIGIDAALRELLKLEKAGA